ncbi:unnamed protein product [Spirodela intermedia]|uniref:RWD domain-containing protein n=1 Tax=Spirodela intermedia TaxID=51605 RepID=A0A7I8JIP6_SPIIN|nr:unnamed protein product [Spirodela intermedia]CAA6669801.1 unnamed protein product [Spirodela intermedia]
MEAAAAAAAEEEVQEELEAVVAVYGEDCRVLQTFPPHINVSIRPRTADDPAQQFVEAVLGVRAGARYPAEPPHVILVESKGLDEERHEKLTTIVRNKAQELSSRPMLIALCEGLIWFFALLVIAFSDGGTGFNKKISFRELDLLFRKIESEEVAGWDLLCSDEENRRREKFEALLRLQREHSGLIEPKKDLIVAPGMFLPEWASPASGGGDAAGELPAMASGSPPRAARRRGREGAGLTGGNIQRAVE